MGRLIICLVGLVISGVASAISPSIDDLYKMLLEQRQEIASLKTNQAALRREVLNSKLQEAQLRDELQETRVQFASIHSPAEIELPDNKPRREAAFVASAGPLYVQPILSQVDVPGASVDSHLGFDVSGTYLAENGWDYSLSYRHFSTQDTWVLNTAGILSDPPITNIPDRRYDLNYDVVDLAIGKYFEVSDDVSVTASAGLRYAAIDEEFNSIVLANPTSRVSSYENDLYGVGPRLGIAPIWTPFGDNLYLSGTLARSFLMGGREPAVGNIDATVFFTMLETSAGIGYRFKSDLGEFDMLAGYEYQSTVPLGLGTSFDLQYRGYKGAFGKLAMRY